jgi:PAS domain S-box-containing protein
MMDYPFFSDSLPLLCAYGIIAALLVLLYWLRRQATAASIRVRQLQVGADSRLALAFQQNSDPMCINEWDGTILEVNQVFCEIFGYAPEELLGKNSVALHLWPGPEVQRKQMVALLHEKGFVKNLEVEFRNKAGEIVPILLSVSLLTIEGRDCLLSNIRDLSAIKAMERKNWKLDRQLAQAGNIEAMGTLLGGFSHQFNNILTSIIGYSELVLEDADADSQTAADVNRILEKATEAQRLVQQILYFSKCQPQAKQRINVFQLLRHVTLKVQLLESANLKVETRLAGDSAWIVADPVSLQLVLLNICRNGIEAMPQGGRLIIGLQYPSVAGQRFAHVDDGLPAGDYVHLYIKDEGQGMDADIMDRVFNPFFTTKQLGQGVGMGLSVVHGIVEDHDGIIRVNSRKGYGSTFHLFFPVVGGESNG